ncbi:hypothetical protein HNY73_017885 [Argiope bruennichi]|uniref:Uncharacterized protein n=1 Tax=Argiope bruennichi TaxID=94029 RepID=A0A8T0ECH4_ARGBR|nr:hypothetical protein HNY73_017885 [Argiope bruennichi]
MGDKEEKVEKKKEGIIKRYCCACCRGDEEKEDDTKKDIQYENWKDLSDSPHEDSRVEKTLASAKAAAEKAKKSLEASEKGNKKKKGDPEDPLFVAESSSDELRVISEEVDDKADDSKKKKKSGKDKPEKPSADKKKNEVDEKKEESESEKKTDDDETPKEEKIADEETTKEDTEDDKTKKDDKEKKGTGEIIKGALKLSAKQNKEKESKATSNIDVESKDLSVLEASSPSDEKPKDEKKSDTKEESDKKETSKEEKSDPKKEPEKSEKKTDEKIESPKKEDDVPKEDTDPDDTKDIETEQPTEPETEKAKKKSNLACCWKKSDTESDSEDEESSSEEALDKYSDLDDSTQKVLVYTKAITDRTRKGFSPKSYSKRESDPESEKKKYIHQLLGFIPEESQNSRTQEIERILEKQDTPQDYYKSKDNGSGKIESDKILKNGRKQDDKNDFKKDEKQTEKNCEIVEAFKSGEKRDSDRAEDKREPMEDSGSKTAQGSKIDLNNNKSEALTTSKDTSKQENGMEHKDKNDFSVDSQPLAEDSKVSEDSTEIKTEVGETVARPVSESVIIAKDQTRRDNDKKERSNNEIAKKSGKAEDETEVVFDGRNIDKEEKQKENVDGDDIDAKKSSNEEEKSKEGSGTPLEQDQIRIDTKEELTGEEIPNTIQERKDDDDAGSDKTEENLTGESESAEKTEFDDKSVSGHTEGDAEETEATQSTKQEDFMDERNRKFRKQAIESGILTEEDVRTFGSTTVNKYSKSDEKGEDPEDGLARKSISNEKEEKKGDDKGAISKRISLKGTSKQTESSEKPTFGFKSVPPDAEAQTHSDDAMQSTRKMEIRDAKEKIVETSSSETYKLSEEDYKSFGSTRINSKPEEKRDDPEEGFKSSGDLSSTEEKKDDELKSSAKYMSLDDILKLSESAEKTKFGSNDDFSASIEDKKGEDDAKESTKENKNKDEKKKTIKRVIESGLLTEEDLKAFGSQSNSKNTQ